jgi:hypothetical protein
LTVELGRVEESDAEFDGSVEQRDRGILIERFSAGSLAELHGAESDAGNRAPCQERLTTGECAGCWHDLRPPVGYWN